MDEIKKAEDADIQARLDAFYALDEEDRKRVLANEQRLNVRVTEELDLLAKRKLENMSAEEAEIVALKEAEMERLVKEANREKRRILGESVSNSEEEKEAEEALERMMKEDEEECGMFDNMDGGDNFDDMMDNLGFDGMEDSDARFDMMKNESKVKLNKDETKKIKKSKIDDSMNKNEDSKWDFESGKIVSKKKIKGGKKAGMKNDSERSIAGKKKSVDDSGLEKDEVSKNNDSQWDFASGKPVAKKKKVVKKAPTGKGKKGSDSD